MKLVCVAPDTECNSIIDDKLTNLISCASAAETPVIYCLSRRKLAKACHLSMRQAVVGVYNPDGVYDLFKKIIAFIDSYSNSNESPEQQQL